MAASRAPKGPLLSMAASRAPKGPLLSLLVEHLKVLNSRACYRILMVEPPNGPYGRACFRILNSRAC